jgi:hypothetical protein
LKISATCSGGYAGQVERIDIDTARVPTGKSIETMLDDVNFFAAASPPSVGADITRCEITVEDGQRRHSVSFAEDGSAKSAPWQALLAHIRAAAAR